MTNEETAWVAGVLEGEGCFDLVHGKYPRVRVEMADHDIIQRLHGLVGGTVHFPTTRKPKWTQTAALAVRRRELVEPLLLAVLPWMGERRKAKIESLLAAVNEM